MTVQLSNELSRLSAGRFGVSAILACIGDSRLAQSLQVLTVSSIYRQVSSMPIGPMAWVTPLSNGRVFHPMRHNLAVSGSTSSQALARVPDVIALNPMPTHCALLTGTNDIGAGADVATIYDNVIRTWEALRVAGVEPIGIADLPRSVSTWSLAASKKSMQLNYMLRIAAEEMRVPFIDVAELAADSASANGDPKSGYTYDGIHPVTTLAKILGQKIADLFSAAPRAIRPGSRVDVYDATSSPDGNGTQYGLMTGTAGTVTSSGGVVSGTVADGWNVRSLTGSGTAVCSKEARTDAAGDWQVVVYDSPAGVSTYRTGLITTLTASAIGAAPGDLVYIGMDVDVAGSAALEDMPIQCQGFDGSSFNNGSIAMKSTLVSSTYYPYNFNWSGRIYTDPFEVVNASDQLIIRIEPRLNSGSATIKIGSVEIRKA